MLFVIFPGASDEMEVAINWYYSRQDALANLLLKDLDATMELIQKNPHQFPVKNDFFREVPLNDFP